jgi:hypothetical protein
MTLIPNPRDFNKFIAVLKKRPFHMLPAVNTLFNALLMHPEFKSIDFSTLFVSQAGGMAASEGTARKWFEATGCPMIEGWGMSETCAIGTNNPVSNTTFTGTIGLPLPSIEIAIKDDDGHSLPAGAAGELCIKGPNVMTGYYNQPAETAAAFTADGFMRTGDIAVMQEDGYSRIVDRKKDMILVSGFNVFPNELENVISLCPGVVECAAVGVPDEKQGEAIKVFVVRRDPTLTEEAVLQYCHAQLTGYKRPKHIEFRDSLPKTNVGKILRRELRTSASGRLNEPCLGERRPAGECRRVRAGVAVFQQYPVCGSDETAVVDTGYATHAEQTLALVESVLGPRPLDRILNTHLHSDHCGGNAALQTRYPAVRTDIPPGEAALVERWDEAGLEFSGDGAELPAVPVHRIVAAGSGMRARRAPWEVHAAPGHDPHSIILFEPSRAR